MRVCLSVCLSVSVCGRPCVSVSAAKWMVTARASYSPCGPVTGAVSRVHTDESVHAAAQFVHSRSAVLPFFARQLQRPTMVRFSSPLVTLSLLWLLAALGYTRAASTCIRQPEGIRIPKTPGDNGYRVKISGNPDKYVPGEVYTGNQTLQAPFMRMTVSQGDTCSS